MALWERGDKGGRAVIEAYTSTPLPLLTILGETPGTRDSLTRALRTIQEALAGSATAEEALTGAEAVKAPAGDADLFVLFLASWAELAQQSGRLPEATAILHRATSLTTDRTPPEIQAALMHVDGLLAGARGNKTKREAIMKTLLDELPADSPRRRQYVWNLACFLALQGRATEVEDDLRQLAWQCDENFTISRVTILRFVDAVETGRVAEATKLFPNLERDRQIHNFTSDLSYPDYRALLNLLRRMDDEGQSRADGAKPSTEPWAVVVRCLLERRTPQALRWAREEAASTARPAPQPGFATFNLVRAELAAGNGEAAMRLLQRRRGQGNAHHLDDFFLARVALLLGNKADAARHFAAVVKAVDRYQASGRLDFELRLANELAPGDLVNLTQQASRPVAGAGQKIDEQTVAPADRTGVDRLIGRSPAMNAIREAIQRFAPHDQSVLITGNTGTGKEVVAQALHETGPRRDQPFIAINCGAIAESLLESELFGHQRGAFTGAEKTHNGVFVAAAKGTLLLDEIGDISPRLQVALLRVLESGEIRPVGSSRTLKVDCRVLAATNARLAEMVESGTFRRDLLYRLQRLKIDIPPLRERPEDILHLARHFLDLDRKVGVHASLAPTLIAALRSYEWPGNVRELRTVIENMRLLNSDKLSYVLDDIDETVRHAHRPAASGPSRGARASADAPVNGPSPSGDADPVAAILKGGRSQMRRLDRLRELFTEHRKLTRSEIIQILEVSPNTATKDLKALAADGFITKIMPNTSSRTHYFVLADKP